MQCATGLRQPLDEMNHDDRPGRARWISPSGPVTRLKRPKADVAPGEGEGLAWPQTGVARPWFAVEAS